MDESIDDVFEVALVSTSITPNWCSIETFKYNDADIIRGLFSIQGIERHKRLVVDCHNQKQYILQLERQNRALKEQIGGMTLSLVEDETKNEVNNNGRRQNGRKAVSKPGSKHAGNRRNTRKIS